MAFFLVDSMGNESIINFRARGPYIVVERVAPRFTLRHGNSVVCVFGNEAMTLKKPAKKSSSWFSGSGDSDTSNREPVNGSSSAGIQK